MLLFWSAFAADPSPAILTPSVGLGEPRGETQVVGWVGAVGRTTGLAGTTVKTRLDRWAFGGELGLDVTGGQVGSAWAGVSVISRDDLRITPFVRGGTWAQVGISAAWRVWWKPFQRRGLRVDASWGPTVDVRFLRTPSWAGPVDTLRSLPEFGLTTEWGPLIQFRVGAIGPMPMFTYRVETPGRQSFVVEMSIGGMPEVGVVGSMSLGLGQLFARGGDSPRPRAGVRSE
jgi:hypothetical protein